ncbi:protein PIN-LIKES 7-like isoform X1 [Momordica charantia]|uniref:Protein PIN-LIKES 7-like isoform X1 n=1 Tax=Momordica charantia TaxID=3673 RepID=A0A6J1DVL1_MOMCH|nr:protein PIN-LIKES 7-like isoform X1 [Momordica charantia]XP_022158263.1 protein PIN-LIKES 7-like isoform X1 [Momordica charantia]
MGLLSLLEVALMPNLQVLLICLLGAFLATDYCNILPAHARNSLNKIVFTVFTPCLMFANLAKTVTFQDIISWWFMPLNIGLTFLLGGILGWIAVKILKPKPYLEGLIIGTSSAGNLGNLLLIIIPAICAEEGSPFGDRETCSSLGLSYASFSAALGGFYLWTSTFHLVKTSSLRLKELEASEELLKAPNQASNAALHTHLLHNQHNGEEIESQQPVAILQKQEPASLWAKILQLFHVIIEELMAPPSLGAASHSWVAGSISSNPRCYSTTRGRNDPLYHSYTRGQPDSRATIVEGEGVDDRRGDRCSVLCTARNWRFCGERCQCLGVSVAGSSVSILVDDSVYDAAGDGDQHHDSVVWGWSRRMLGYIAMDLFGCSSCSCCLVCSLHVDLVLILFPFLTFNFFTFTHPFCILLPYFKYRN